MSDKERGPLVAVEEPLVLLFGAENLLAKALTPALLFRDVRVCSPTPEEVDLEDPAAVALALEEERPHLVAYLGTDDDAARCEADEAGAFQRNALSPHLLAVACGDAGVPLLHLSGDSVFEGGVVDAGGGQRGEDRPLGAPESVLGRSLALGEMLVRRHTREHYIVRVGPLFGAGGHDLVSSLEARLAAHEARYETPLALGDDDWRSPTFAIAAAEQLVALLSTRRFGTYHVANQGAATTLGFCRELLSLQGEDTGRVVAREPSEARSACRALDPLLLRVHGLLSLTSWQDALARYVATRGPTPR